MIVWHSLRRLFLWLLGLSIGGFILSFCFALFFVLSQYGGNGSLPADCAIVFGASVQSAFDSNGKIHPDNTNSAIIRRVGTAAELYKKGLVQHLYMSGGRGQGMLLSEASVMRDLAVLDGVKAKDITLEDQSRNTEENIRNTRPLTEKCSSIVGISDAYHLARIEFIAQTLGWKLSTVPAQGSIPAEFEDFSVIREVFALFMFTVNGLLT